MHFVERPEHFPDPSDCAADDPCAISVQLGPELISGGYRRGFFPWGESFGHPLWYSPDPRFVLFTQELIFSKSLRPVLNQGRFHITVNLEFRRVIEQCQKIRRPGQKGSWITDETIDAFCQLHEDGKAWSVEAWNGDRLVGGLYGLVLGNIFFGESMFSLEPDASKAAFVEFIRSLRDQGVELVDCQYYTEHLERFGARHISRDQFVAILNREVTKGSPQFYSGSLTRSD